MADSHLTLELLREVHRGDRNPGEVAVLALAHLFELCPRCQEAFNTWRRTIGEEATEPMRPATRGVACERSADHPSVIDRESTRDWIDQIQALPEEERLGRLRQDSARDQGPRLAELLLEEAGSCLPDRPREARVLAGLARAVLQHGNNNRRTALLYARAVGHEGNAARALGDVQTAEDLLESGRFLLATEGCENPVALAEFDKQEGTLRRFQGRLAEAEVLLSRAAATFAREGRPLEAARTLISLGIVYNERRDLERAIAVTEKALEPLELAADPLALLCARHNLAQNLYQSGRTRAARRVFDGAQALYKQASDDWAGVYRRWLGAHLHRAEGSLGLSEAGYREARKACLDQGMEYRAALVAKDLASLYAEQGRLHDLERLVQEIVPVFEAQEVYYEVDKVRRILQDASAAEPSVH